MNAWRIRTRILVTTLLPAAVVTIVLIALFSMQQFQHLDSGLKARGSAIARQLAPACEFGVFSGNRTLLRSLSEAAIQDPDVAAVSIIDAAEQLLSSVRANDRIVDTEYRIREPIMRRALLDPGSEAVLQLESPGARANSDGVLGWVVLDLTVQHVRHAQQTVLVRNVLIGVLGLGAIVIVSLRMSSSLSDPVEQLSAVVESIGQGDLSPRALESSGGELGVLESGINRMVIALAQARQQERQLADDRLFVEQMRAQTTLASIGDAVITTNEEGRIGYMNPAAERLLNCSLPEVVNKPLSDVMVIQDEHRERVGSYPLERCLHDGEVMRNQQHMLLVTREERSYLVQDTASPIRDRDGAIVGAVVVLRDVTQMRHMARRMEFLARHDALTGLLNRREFEVRLQQALDNARNDNDIYTLCYMDMDQFKIVNDTCGHVAGDELLKQLAQLLRSKVRNSDVLARLGGDEFGLILDGCSIKQAQELTEGLREAMADYRFSWRERSFGVGVSIGLVPVTASSGSIVDLLSAADSACYVAKDKGRNTVHVYQDDDADLMKRHGEMQWVHRLKDALADDSFCLWCQEIRPVANQSDLTMYELLLRIQDAQLVSPTVFLTAAERYYLMPSIDRWVVRNAFVTLAPVLAALAQSPGVALPCFTINLSGQSLCDDGFLEFVQDQVDRTGMPMASVCFEITETAAIENLSRAQIFIDKLMARGCRFALDDFGSGLSSFGYLKSLAVDYLKIDGGFVQDILDDPIHAGMVRAISDIGHIMGLKTVAESVENAPTMEHVAQLGIDYVQGTGVAAVVPLDYITRDLLSLIRHRSG